MSDDEDLWLDIPKYAWISLARRGMEKISLDQCFLKGCDNQDRSLLEPFKKESYEDEKRQVTLVHIKCNKCNRVFQLKMESLKKVARPTKPDDNKSEDEQALSMGLVYALDENGNDLGHIGYF